MTGILGACDLTDSSSGTKEKAKVADSKNNDKSDKTTTDKNKSTKQKRTDKDKQTISDKSKSKTEDKGSSTKSTKSGEQKSSPDKKTSSKSSSTTTKTSTPKGLIPVTVSKETDGDTIHVKMPSGQDETIRMLLIDTPETHDPRKPVEPYGPQASSFAEKELPVGKHIYIQEGVKGHRRGKYGRLLAFVYVNKHEMYNKDVLKNGLARVAYIYPPNTQHLSDLKAAQKYAQDHKLGIWSMSGYVES